jgi:type I restriction enzyme R subunit
VYTDFEDAFTGSQVIDLPGATPGTNFERFKQKAEAYLRAHDENLSLQKLRRGKALTQSDLDELGRMLEDSGAARSDIELGETSAGSLGRFIRSLVGLERSAVEDAFASLLAQQNFGVNQIRFIELLVDELTRNGVMDQGRLYESPFTDYSPAGPDQIFAGRHIATILNLVENFNTSAEVFAA